MYKNYPLNLKTTLSDGWFLGYASVFNVVDQQNEQVAQGAFTKTLLQWQRNKQMPKMLWQHDPKSPIGLWRHIVEDEHGLRVEGQLMIDLRQGQEAYMLLKKGIVDGLSIGFTVTRVRKNYLTKTRILEEISLYEISLVTFAANPQARILSCKTIDPLTRQINNLTASLSINTPTH